MKRSIRTMCVFLLLISGGAIVNVAVAWGCALWCSQERYSDEVVASQPVQWPAYLEELGWPQPSETVELELLDGIGVTIITTTGGDPSASYQRTDPGDRVHVSLETRQFGLPVPALQWELNGVTAGACSLEMVKAAASAAGLRTGIDVSEMTGAIDEGQMRCVPLTPLWPGFAFNTIFYASVLWLLFAGPRRMRRMIRRRRGQCPKCAYDLRGRGSQSDGCPECGAKYDSTFGALYEPDKK